MSFNFVEFAATIYRENPQAYVEPFLLPALYGGEVCREYEAMFVLQAPSLKFTLQYWGDPCDTDENAIERHRQIFLKWAYMPKSFQIDLFRSFDPTGSTFFQRFYVTDLWKDARTETTAESPEDYLEAHWLATLPTRQYNEYWDKQLELELNNVPTKHIIFVGREPEKRQGLLHREVYTYHIDFPSGSNRKLNDPVFKATYIQKLHTQMGLNGYRN